MSYGHSTQFIISQNGNPIETATWDSALNRWQGPTLFIFLQTVVGGKRWILRNATSGTTAAFSDTIFTDGETNNSPADVTYENGYSVSEPSAGAQGDPHIKPLFGQKYTI